MIAMIWMGKEVIAILIFSLTKYKFFCLIVFLLDIQSRLFQGLGGAKSGQTSIKCCDLACDAESTLLKNCEDFNIKLEVKYIFLTSYWGVDFYIYQLSEGLGMRKISAHGIRMQKNQTRADIFCIFTDLHGAMQVPSPTYTPTQTFHQ